MPSIDDRDLEQMPTDHLLREIRTLQGLLKPVDRYRTRRDRAYRVLLNRGVPRIKIAEEADVTPSAVGQSVKLLNQREGHRLTGPRVTRARTAG